MQLKLNVYKDDTLTELDREVTADKLKIPYRVAMYVIQSLDDIDLDNETDVLKLLTSNVDKVDKIIKATFGLNDDELECIDAAELVATAKELYQWAIGKVNGIKGGNSKNA